MVKQAAELDAQVADIRNALAARRQHARELFYQAKANASPRARSPIGHWCCNLVNSNYRESHLLLESRSRELAEIEFRLRAVRLYTSLHGQAGTLRSRLTETQFSKDLDEDLSRGAASLSQDLVQAVSPTDPYCELTEEQRARVADRLREFEGLIEITMKELDQRIHESDVSKWFAGDTRPAAPRTTDAATEEASSLEKLQNQLAKTRNEMQQTHDGLDSLRTWVTFLGALWVFDLLDDD